VVSLIRLLSVKEVSEILQVSAQTIYEWRIKGEGPKGVKVGGCLRFHPSDVVEWLQQQRAEASIEADSKRAWAERTDDLKARLKRRGRKGSLEWGRSEGTAPATRPATEILADD
jgi:excisionase family DNA binding protein